MSKLKSVIEVLKNTLEYLDEVENDKKFQKILKKYSNQTVNVEINNEEWRDIKVNDIDYNYQVSNFGNVRNKLTKHVLNTILRDGYISICVTDKAFKIHRLVALMFINNEDTENKPIVNHIDGNKLNNHYTNLEWTSIKENNQHAIDNGLTKITKRRVTQLDMDNNIIETFESLDEAAKKTNINDAGIAKVCKGSRNTAGGFKWKYTDINPNEQELSEDELMLFVEVKNFPNYIIDKLGRVYSKPYNKFLKTIVTRDGSSELQLTHKGNRKTYLLHNLMAEQFLEKIEGKNVVGHINRNKLDNRLVNLKRVTHSELCIMAYNHNNNCK